MVRRRGTAPDENIVNDDLQKSITEDFVIHESNNLLILSTP